MALAFNALKSQPVAGINHAHHTMLCIHLVAILMPVASGESSRKRIIV